MKVAFTLLRRDSLKGGRIRMKKISLLIGLSCFFISQSLVAYGENSGVKNGDFTQVQTATGKWHEQEALHWNDVWVAKGKPGISIISDEGEQTNNILKIAATEVSRVAISQDIPVLENQEYEVTGRIKTESVTASQGARIRVLRYANGKQIDPLSYSNNVLGTKDWQNVKAKVNTEQGIDTIRVQLFLEEGTGTAYFDDIQLTKKETLTSLAFKETQLILEKGTTETLAFEVVPATFPVEELTWHSSNEKVLTVAGGEVTALGKGISTVSVTYGDSGVKAQVVIEVTSDEPVTEELPAFEKSQEVTVSEMKLLFSEQLPENYQLKLENSEIGQLKGGVFLAQQAGQTQVRIFDSENQLVDEIQLTVTPQRTDEFDRMRQGWQGIIFGDQYYQGDNQQMNDTHELKEQTVKKIWESLNKNDNPPYLWEHLKDQADSSTLTKNYRELYKLAEAVVNPYSTYYLNEALYRDVLRSLEWLYIHRYNENLVITGNWWDFEIGTPRALNDIVTVLYGGLTKEQISRYLTPIDTFVPDVHYIFGSIPERKQLALGGNQIDIGKVKLIQNLLLKNDVEVKTAISALQTVLPYVTEGEGFYRDGSFISHTNVAYTGAYGNVLIEGLSQLLTVIQPTSYAISEEDLSNVYEWLENAFQPILYKGSLMDMTRGRSMSRSALQDHQAAVEVLRAMLRIAEISTAEKQLALKQVVKYHLLADSYFDYVASAGSFRDISLVQNLLSNPEIAGRQPVSYLRNFAHMDKIAYYNSEKDFAFGISLHSKRTQNYEDMNNENRRGWYTGDGMTYLYNDDLSHYSDDYWATVDPYRLPGTTVTREKRADGSGETVGQSDFVGGTVLDDQFGVFSMDFNNWNQSLTAKKGWFMFGDKIVAVGSDIQTTSTDSLETIIENRKVPRGTESQLMINGEVTALTAGEEQNIAKPVTMYLDNGRESRNIGYQFLVKGNIHVLRDNRVGTWGDINHAEKGGPVSNQFMTIWQEQQANSTYGYIIYPNIGVEAFTKAAKMNQIEILKNDEDSQIVVDHELGMTGLINYQTKAQKIAGLTFYDKGTYLLKEAETVTISLADPTLTPNKVVTFSYDPLKYKIIGDKLNTKAQGSEVVVEVILQSGESQKVELAKISNETDDSSSEPENSTSEPATTKEPGNSTSESATTKEPESSTSELATTKEPGNSTSELATTKEPGNSSSELAPTRSSKGNQNQLTKEQEKAQITGKLPQTSEKTSRIIGSLGGGLLIIGGIIMRRKE